VKLVGVVDPVFVCLGVEVVRLTVCLEMFVDSISEIVECFVSGAGVIVGILAEKNL
jgi:hypothetical protein